MVAINKEVINKSEDFWRIQVTGVVQSVGFRPFIKKLADDMQITGGVKNLGNQGVEIWFSGNKDLLDTFITRLKREKPTLADIYDITMESLENQDLSWNDFEIMPSAPSINSGIAPIPPDIAICDPCQDDILTPTRRKDYPFTSCTDCGPRYATIKSLPYDRIRTSFDEFPLCTECLREYKTLKNRRYHAQTTACPSCGPEYQLYQRIGETWELIDFSWSLICEAINRGEILAIMGLSGTHYVIDALQPQQVMKFRKRRRKDSNKPFAMMARNLDYVKTIVKIDNLTSKQLLSLRKPILVIPSIEPEKWKHISPNLNNLGIMLPYSGFHILLFAQDISPVLVMTSANTPNIPMPITAEKVLEQCTLAKYALVHNRKIVARSDDSVIKQLANQHLIIRRSRGFVPSPIFHEGLIKLPATLALGAEQVNTAALGYRGQIIATQHLGDITSVENLCFETESISHLQQLYGLTHFENIIIDMHPNFLQRQHLSEFDYSDLFEIQHHVAHTASLALDRNIGIGEPFLAWACDGFGYGTDGQAWGGELIYLDGNEGWKRAASLTPISYSGGDMNAKYPGRVLVQYLKAINVDPTIFFRDREQEYFKHGKKELDLIISHDSSIVTSSTGRFLDAVAALLGLTYKRTYRGEPAIILESHALSSGNRYLPEPFVNFTGKIPHVDTITLFDHIFSYYQANEKSSSDIARYAHDALSTSLAEIGHQIASSYNLQSIGLTGGVAYNSILTETMGLYLSHKEMTLITHERIPPGDAGISAGQIYEVGRMYGN